METLQLQLYIHCLWWQVQALQIQKWAKHLQQEACERNSRVQESSIGPVIHRGSLALTLANAWQTPQRLSHLNGCDEPTQSSHVMHYVYPYSKGRKWHAFIVFHFSGIFTALSAHSHENTRLDLSTFTWALKVKYPNAFGRCFLVYWLFDVLFRVKGLNAERESGRLRRCHVQQPPAVGSPGKGKSKGSKGKGPPLPAAKPTVKAGRSDDIRQFIILQCRPCNIPQ